MNLSKNTSDFKNFISKDDKMKIKYLNVFTQFNAFMLLMIFLI